MGRVKKFLDRKGGECMTQRPVIGNPPPHKGETKDIAKGYEHSEFFVVGIVEARLLFSVVIPIAKNGDKRRQSSE